MPVNLYDTRTLLASGEAYAPQPTFLRDRYFPTGAGEPKNRSGMRKFFTLFRFVCR